MADVFDVGSDELCPLCINKVKNVFTNLKKTNNDIETLIKKTDEFRREIEKFKYKLKDQTIATIIEEYSPLDTIDNVDLFISDLLRTVIQLRQELNLKIDELGIYLMDEVENLHDEDCVSGLLIEITNIEKMMSAVLNGFRKNNGVQLFLQMVVKFESMKSE